MIRRSIVTGFAIAVSVCVASFCTPASADDLQFKTLSLLNGWTGAVFSTRTPAVAITSENIVVFKGAMGNGTTSGAFRLGKKFRPDANVYVPVDLCNAAKGRLLILPDGNVSVQAENTFADAQCFTSLEGASFVK